ncbi:MAG: glycoside hydrolase family 3 C-terminal domain-containing protein [Anaerolineae bacterium]|nr:glycoside hydrolase family 3 C-terminal domain-containing protein [Anaerolineae bacterium]
MLSLEEAVYMNPNVSTEERVRDLVSRMTLEEKISQTLFEAPDIERLGVPAYNWWNECLHGVGRAGIATVFPQAIGMAASWDVPLMHRTAEAISDEARAKHHANLGQDGSSDWYYGLTFWTPNINIFRDPRWGRGQETYGEDPFLTARMAVAFIQGLQGDDPKYLKTVATSKHFAVHSGPEAERHHFDAVASKRDMVETYLPAFEATVRDAQVHSFMGAYNRTNGEPCCASPTLLQNILRDTWGFDGYVVSDCGAIRDIHANHKVVSTPQEAAALAVKNGCDLNCGEVYHALLQAVEQGMIDEATIDMAVSRLFTARIKLGMFDPPERVPYAQIPIEVNDCPAHRELALKMAQASIVLLKNADNLLPLNKGIRSVAVIGPNADAPVVLLSNYFGTPSSSVPPLAGIKNKVGAAVDVHYAKGCGIRDPSTAGFAEAVRIAEKSDVVIAVVGLSQLVEGEEGQQEGVPEGLHSTGDREDLALPGVQEALLQALHATGKPLVVVLVNGSAVAVNWAQTHAQAVVELWYPGEEGGTALADMLFGDYNPAGRMPVTFYHSVDDLPPFQDYAMAGHTYRFFDGEPLYPFGYGLSYTQFTYANLEMSNAVIEPGESLSVQVTVENSGLLAGDEVVQLYVKDVEASVPVPIRHLEGFQRVHILPGESCQVSFELKPEQLAVILDNGQRAVEPGEFKIFIGGGQPHTGAPGLAGSFVVAGELFLL